ncbi:hypothetical protein [Nocardia noduli]|uniref:hypothetical protein n=1 Tax=Nocardia noduli TaxID=2815722 RepID=UPI001C241A47|nr:hypothetical protein [Nocardia noduli]
MRRPVTATSAAILALTAVFTCGTGTGSAHAEKSCGFEFTFSQPTVLGSQILGRGLAQCDVTPSEHLLTLSLERQQSGRWETISHRTTGALPPGPPNSLSYEVSAACYEGSWRVAMSVTGSLQGRPFVFSDHTRARDITSSQCPSR